MTSRGTTVVKAVLWVVRRPRRRRTVDQEIARIRKDALRPRRFSPPRSLDRVAAIEVTHVDGQVVYRLTPPDRPAQCRIIYLHGGGYVHEIDRQHWRVMAPLVTTLSAEVIVPIYPLAPASVAEDNYARMVRFYRREVERGGPPLIVGDSAGGGMAVALLLQLAEQGVPLPDRAVLISPWLDATVGRQRVHDTAPLDPMISPAMLQAAATLWAGDLPLDDPRVSPIFGDLALLRGVKFKVVTGTHDILNEDARWFRDEGQRVGLQVQFREVEDQPHVFPVLPTREGRAAVARILSFLSSTA